MESWCYPLSNKDPDCPGALGAVTREKWHGPYCVVESNGVSWLFGSSICLFSFKKKKNGFSVVDLSAVNFFCTAE